MPTIRADGATVAYTDTGVPDGVPDAPTIVFGHGLLFSGWMFTAQIEALRSTYRCIAIDWRGQGASPPADDGRYDMDTLTDDALALLDHLGLDRVHWVGLSMGGFVGQRIAARHPQRLLSLTLIETSPDREERFAAIQDKVLTVVYRLVGIRPVRRSVEKIMLGPVFRKDPANRPVVDEWFDQLARADRRGMRGAILAVANRKGVYDEIGSITAPTLVVCGVDDVPTPVAKARRIADAVAGARLELVPECGHSSSIEQPARITELISAFIGSVDRGATPV